MIEHYNKKIQNIIQKELFKANSSIKIAVAWFTNELLFQPLLLKLQTGVSVELVLNKDDINNSKENDIDFSEFVENGGILHWNDSQRLMHEKFCIIDDETVIYGSYNWTNKAEYNDESIAVSNAEQSTVDFYLQIFKELCEKYPAEDSSTKYREYSTPHRTKRKEAEQPGPEVIAKRLNVCGESTTFVGRDDDRSINKFYSSSGFINKYSQGCLLHIKCDFPFKVLHLDKVIAVSSDTELSTKLLPGMYSLRIECLDSPDIFQLVDYSIDTQQEDFIEVHLKQILLEKTRELLKTGAVLCKKDCKITLISIDGKKKLPSIIPFDFCYIKKNVIVLAKDINGHYSPYDWKYNPKYKKEKDRYKVEGIRRTVGAIDFEGNVVLPFGNFAVWPFYGGLACVENIDTHKSGYLNEEGQLVIPFVCDGFDRVFCQNGIISPKIDGIENYYRQNGTKITIPNINIKEHCISAGEHFFIVTDVGYNAKKTNHLGLVNSFGNKTLNVEYETIKLNYHFGLLVAKKLGKKALYSTKGIQLTDHIYDEIEIFDYDKIIVTLNSQKGVITSANKQIIPIQYDEIKCRIYEEHFPYDSKKETFVVIKNNLYGIIDFEGNILADCRFNRVSEPRDGYLFVWQGKHSNFPVKQHSIYGETLYLNHAPGGPRKCVFSVKEKQIVFISPDTYCLGTFNKEMTVFVVQDKNGFLG